MQGLKVDQALVKDPGTRRRKDDQLARWRGVTVQTDICLWCTYPPVEAEMDEQDERKGLGDKRPDTGFVESDDKGLDGASNVGSTSNEDTVRSRIVVRQGRRRETLKKRRPSSTNT